MKSKETENAQNGKSSAEKTPLDEKAHAGKDKSSDEPKKHHSAREKSDHKKNKDKDNEDLKDRLLRLQADFDNFRKRVVREKNEIYQRANENIMEELLPVLDHLDLALEACSVEDSSRALFEGVQLVAVQAKSVLEKFGLKQIDAEGIQFDPSVHEAISHISSDEAPENTVIKQTRKGYMLGNKVLRAAQVVVSSGKASAEQKGA